MAKAGDLQVADMQSTLSVCVTVPRSGRLGGLSASAGLDSGADVSSIPESVLKQLDARLPGVNVRVPLEQGARTVRLINDHVVSATHRPVALQLTVHTP